jgi:hypothetical protein
LITALQPEEAEARTELWKDDADPILRRIAAMTMAAGGSRDQLAWAFRDAYDSVRKEIVECVAKRPDAALFTELLRELASSKSTGWFCLGYGTQNDSTNAPPTACRTCQTTPPDSRRSAREVLKQAGLEFMPPGGPVQHELSSADFE